MESDLRKSKSVSKEIKESELKDQVEYASGPAIEIDTQAIDDDLPKEEEKKNIDQ